MKQNSWITPCRGFAIFLVVLGHAIRGVNSAGLAAGGFWQAADTLIYLFHMPLFFTLSGWFYTASITRKNFKKFAAGRLERLLYPMVIWAYFFLSIKVLSGNLSNTPIDWADIPLLPIPGILHLWFLWDLLLLSFAAYPLKYAVHSRSGNTAFYTLWTVMFAASIILQNGFVPMSWQYWAGTSLYNAPFFLLGVLMGHRQAFEASLSRRWLILAGAGVVAATGLHSATFENGALPLQLAVIVCILTLFQAGHTHLSQPVRSSLSYMGAVSMAIYLMHTIFSASLRAALVAAHITDPTAHIVAGTLIGIMGPIIALSVAQRLRLARITGLEGPAKPAPAKA